LVTGDRALYCIVNLHAITIPQDPKQLLSSTRDMAAALLACGIDPRRSTLFAQSSLGGYHGELTWLLGCSTPMHMLQHMTQFKVTL
jgi:tryptophanyl-tRNA synthetase